MERLTERWGEGDVWVKDHDYVAAAHRLAAYEDTGLTPGEIKSIQGEHFSGLEMAKLYSALMELKKYQEADRDGRLVVLPCYYHGDRILAALTCIVEGQEVNPVSPADVAPVVHARWIPFHSETAGDIQYCSNCEIGNAAKSDFCPNCGAKMDGGDGNALN